jgi:hypothetical protein
VPTAAVLRGRRLLDAGARASFAEAKRLDHHWRRRRRRRRIPRGGSRPSRLLLSSIHCVLCIYVILFPQYHICCSISWPFTRCCSTTQAVVAAAAVSAAAFGWPGICAKVHDRHQQIIDNRGYLNLFSSSVTSKKFGYHSFVINELLNNGNVN